MNCWCSQVDCVDQVEYSVKSEVTGLCIFVVAHYVGERFQQRHQVYFGDAGVLECVATVERQFPSLLDRFFLKALLMSIHGRLVEDAEVLLNDDLRGQG